MWRSVEHGNSSSLSGTATLGWLLRLVLVLMPTVVVITMPPPMIMVAPMAVVVVLAVPTPFVPSPAFAIVVVMRMRPVCPFKRRTLPMSPDPLVTVTRRRPVSVYPNEARAWGRPSLLINDYRWRGPDVHRNLP